MENRIRIMCFLPLVLSVIVTVFYREMNKEPPIDYESYKRMPPLFAADDYDECMKETGAKYCVVNIVLEEDKTSELWNQIEEFSAQEKYHFRHDILKNGLCMGKVRLNLTSNFASKEYKPRAHDQNPFVMNDVRFKQLGKRLTEYKFEDEDERDVQQFVSHKFEDQYGLKALSNVSFCITKEDENEEKGFGYSDLICISLVIILVYSSIIATIADLCHNKDTTIHPKHFYTSISLRTNINRLFNDPANPNQLGVLNGIKVIGEAGVVVVHTAYILLALPTAIPFLIESQMYDPIVPVIRSGIFQLQNFFAITAFLSFYPTLSRILRGDKVSWNDIWMMFVRRLVRLLPLIMFVVAIFSTVLYRVKDGPVWMDLAGTEMMSCRMNWWTNLLFVNNFYGANTDPCLQQTWHLAAEMQLFVVEILIILLIRRFPNRAGTIIGSALVLGNLTTAVTFYWEGITGIVLGTVEHIRTRNAFDHEFQKGHTPFHTNTPGYFIGLLAAYVQYQIKEKRIDLSHKTKLFRIWYGMFLLSGLILLHHSYYVGIVTPPSILISIYSTICKNLGAILTVTLLILMGDVTASSNQLLRSTGFPMIDALLLKVYNFYNHRLFKVLVKLNLGVFLIHPFVAVLIITDGRSLVTYGNTFDVAWIGLGTLFGSYLIAAVLFVMVEMPAINLFRLVLYKRGLGVSEPVRNGEDKKRD